MNPVATVIEKARLMTLTNPVFPMEFPSVTRQTNWECGFYSFPDETPSVEYFNCGLVDYQGSHWLVTRRCKRGYMKNPHNSIVLWKLKDNAPVARHEVKFPTVFAKEEHEDSRAINRNGTIILQYCNFIQGKTFAHQCITGLDKNLNAIRPLHIVYGKNGKNLKSNKGHEKNWIWFEHEGRLHFVYSAIPHEVCRTENGKVTQVYTSDFKNASWSYGEIRGGTPPVRIGDEYFTFFHSSIPWKNKKRRYLMGAYMFSATPPFPILRMTQKPMLVGSENDPRKDTHPCVVFPQGALIKNNEWIVTMGINDCRCAYIRIPHGELLEKLK